MDGDWKVLVPSTVMGIMSLVLLSVFAGGGAVQVSGATATAIPYPTMSLPLTPSPTPWLMEAVAVEQRCSRASAGDDAPPYGAIDVLVYLLNSEPLLEFLNDGGTAETLRAALDQSGNEIGPYLSQVVERDITGDAIPEIFLALTAAVISVDYGESRLIMFRCVEGVYEEEILFLRAGAGVRAEDLYAGGGAHILSIADLNADGAMDLVFEVDWSGDGGEYVEYYVLEWRDGDFHAIVEYQDALRGAIYYIPGDAVGDVAFTDLDADGLYELVVEGMAYRWDGESYRAIGEGD